MQLGWLTEYGSLWWEITLPKKSGWRSSIFKWPCSVWKRSCSIFDSAWTIKLWDIPIFLIRSMGRPPKYLHLWSNEKQAGLGKQFIKQCLAHYFPRFELSKIICEPKANNPAPTAWLLNIRKRTQKPSSLGLRVPHESPLWMLMWLWRNRVMNNREHQNVPSCFAKDPCSIVV